MNLTYSIGTVTITSTADKITGRRTLKYDTARDAENYEQSKMTQDGTLQDDTRRDVTR